jgi:hypothetical protein
MKSMLDLSTQAAAYTNLVGVMSLLPSCKGKTSVVAGQSAMSVLYTAIAPNVPATCGQKMPQAPGKLTMAEIMTIKAWIDSGAPNN